MKRKRKKENQGELNDSAQNWRVRVVLFSDHHFEECHLLLVELGRIEVPRHGRGVRGFRPAATTTGCRCCLLLALLAVHVGLSIRWYDECRVGLRDSLRGVAQHPVLEVVDFALDSANLELHEANRLVEVVPRRLERQGLTRGARAVVFRAPKEVLHLAEGRPPVDGQEAQQSLVGGGRDRTTSWSGSGSTATTGSSGSTRRHRRCGCGCTATRSSSRFIEVVLLLLIVLLLLVVVLVATLAPLGRSCDGGGTDPTFRGQLS